MFERYTERARRTLFFARYEASQLGDQTIATAHVLLGLIRDAPPVVVALLRADKEALEGLRRRIVDAHGARPKTSTAVEIPFSPEVRNALAAAAAEADVLGHARIGTAHLLLGMLRESATATALLGRDDLTVDAARTAIAQLSKTAGID